MRQLRFIFWQIDSYAYRPRLVPHYYHLRVLPVACDGRAMTARPVISYAPGIPPPVAGGAMYPPYAGGSPADPVAVGIPLAAGVGIPEGCGWGDGMPEVCGWGPDGAGAAPLGSCGVWVMPAGMYAPGPAPSCCSSDGPPTISGLWP